MILAMRLLAGLALVVTLLVVDSAGASESASVQAVLNRDGTGQMLANGQTDVAGGTWSWQICLTEGLDCTPFAAGQSVTTGGAAPPAVFQAQASDGPVGRSPVWRGNVSAATLPSVSGAIRANALVTPVDATWIGGWDGDFDRTQLAACVNADGTDCTSLTDRSYLPGCPHEAAVIDPAFTGRYLRIADERNGRDIVFPSPAVSSPYGSLIWTQAPTISVAVLGRIAAANGPREAACGPPPLPTSWPRPLPPQADPSANPPHHMLTLRQVLRIALSRAKFDGDRHPTKVRAAKGRLSKALRVMDTIGKTSFPLQPGGPEAPGNASSQVYLVAMRGHFVVNGPHPHGSPAPKGHVLELIVDAHTGVVEGLSLGPRLRAPLSRLGRVTRLR
jgi:hypothetical protein